MWVDGTESSSPLLHLFSSQNAQSVNISNDKPPLIFTLQMLEPSTHYRGKIRARVHMDGFQGPWSEWSEECTWETESGTSQLGYWLGGGGGQFPP